MSLNAPAKRSDTLDDERQPWSLRLAGALASVGNWTLLAMMVLMVVDVVGRKAIDRPLPGAVELVERLLLLTVYAGIPLVSASQRHIRIELADSVFPAWLQTLRARAGEAFCALVMLGCAVLVLLRAVHALQDGDSTTLLRISLWPSYGAVALLLLATAITHADTAVRRGAVHP
jgi:TRAP-type transport system small permease protein